MPHTDKRTREPRETREEKLLDFTKMNAIIHKNFVVIVRDKTRLIPLLLFPIFMILVFGFTSGNSPKHIPTAIVVYDTSPLAHAFEQAVMDNDAFAVRHVVSTEGEAKRLLDAGEVEAIIEVPPGLGTTVGTGGHSAITVIVDESDSSVAASAHQALVATVNQFAAQLRAQRFIAYQASVGAASDQLRTDLQQGPNDNALIAARAAAAQAELAQAKKITDTQADILVRTAPNPTVIVTQDAEHENSTSENTFSDQSAAAPSKAQAALLLRSSAAVGAAAENVQAIDSIATQAAQDQAAAHESQAYADNVLAPLQTIDTFARASATDTLEPLVIDEKSAYGTGKRPVDFLIPTIIALVVFQGAVMGMGRAVAGEKREGSLTRVFLTPTSNATIIGGTLSFYVLFELLRSAFLIGLSIMIFNITIEGNVLLIMLIMIIYTTIAAGIGMILSSMVKSEGQYMALAMLVSMPTMFLAGAFIPLRAMPSALQALARVLPVTYASEALRSVMIKGFSIGAILTPLGILLAFLAAILGLLFIVFKRDIE